jgi:hypothetical protein
MLKPLNCPFLFLKFTKVDMTGILFFIKNLKCNVMKTKLLMIIGFLMAFQFVNAQMVVTIFVDGVAYNPMQVLYACPDSCYNVSALATGGYPPYAYEWSNGATTQSTEYCASDIQSGEDTISVYVMDMSIIDKWARIRFMDHIDVCQEICIVTIDSATNKNMIVWEQNTDASIESYNIYKETFVTDEFELIGNVPRVNESVFIDNSSNPNQVSSKYSIKAVRGCMESNFCSFHKTMHLAINQGSGNTWNLIWEPYQGIPVSTYYIYRGTSSNNLQLLGSTSSSSTQFSDFSAPSGYVYYQVAIVTSPCNPSKSYTTSKSNIATNKPDGINETSEINGITIYPNPVSDKIDISLDANAFDTEINLTIYSVLGQKILFKKLLERFESIDLSDLPKGCYFLEIMGNGKISIGKKLIKL